MVSGPRRTPGRTSGWFAFAVLSRNGGAGARRKRPYLVFRISYLGVRQTRPEAGDRIARGDARARERIRADGLSVVAVASSASTPGIDRDGRSVGIEADGADQVLEVVQTRGVGKDAAPIGGRRNREDDLPLADLAIDTERIEGRSSDRLLVSDAIGHEEVDPAAFDLFQMLCKWGHVISPNVAGKQLLGHGE